MGLRYCQIDDKLIIKSHYSCASLKRVCDVSVTCQCMSGARC
jgi:hypothetical protein